jgi:Domain of unknown function (DUF4291)
MKLLTEPYLTQVERWPSSGRHILAQFDDNSIVVYQAYRPAIGQFAAKNGYFGGEFSLNRMSWIKTNFLWMMYRSGWGTKADQSVILAIWLKRSAFDQILAATVPSSYSPEFYSSQQEWEIAVKRSQVRLQWDPDYDPCQNQRQRRAIQLGLRGEILSHYARDWIVNIEDISDFVQQQYPNRLVENRQHLLTPLESVYPVTDPDIIKKLGLSSLP